MDPAALAETSLFVGFAPKGSDTGATILQFKLKTSNTVDSTLADKLGQWLPRSRAEGAFEVIVWEWKLNPNTNTWQFERPSPLPQWIDAARVWARNAGVNDPDLSSIGGPDGATPRRQWIVQLRVPVDLTAAGALHLDPRGLTDCVTPVISRGKLYLRTPTELLCIDVRGGK